MPIVSIKHKGLRRYWEHGGASKLNRSWLPRLDARLQFMHAATCLDDLAANPGLRLHELQGVDRFSIRLTGNWRLTFEWIEGEIHLLDIEDYH